MPERYQAMALSVKVKKSGSGKVGGTLVASVGPTNPAKTSSKRAKAEKYAYARPYFLGLNKDEVQHSQDFGMRPILVPRNIQEMPLFAGYAECVNGGKSDNNEDNSFACEMCIKSMPPNHTGNRNSIHKDNETSTADGTYKPVELDAVYFGLFDGHAGPQTSLIASRCLQSHLQDSLSMCVDVVVQKLNTVKVDVFDDLLKISEDDLIIGSLEKAFLLMDHQLRTDSIIYNVKGGCTALVVLCMNGRIYIANAGDSRAVLGLGEAIKAVSNDFTPESEKQRIYKLGEAQPELLHGEFSCLEFPRRVNARDIGTQMLCRHPGYSGWSYKVIDEDDLRFPLVNGIGKNTRIMATIGVSRGLGDHDLYVYDTDIWIKPFLSSQPEVQVTDLREQDCDDMDILIVGTDGLWDVLTNNEAVNIVRKSIKSLPITNKNRYTIAAQELVSEAKGIFTGQGWKKLNGENASFDDISAFVIPVQAYREKWRNNRAQSDADNNEQESENDLVDGKVPTSGNGLQSSKDPQRNKTQDGEAPQSDAQSREIPQGANDRQSGNYHPRQIAPQNDPQDKNIQQSENISQNEIAQQHEVNPQNQKDRQSENDPRKNTSDQAFSNKQPQQNPSSGNEPQSEPDPQNSYSENTNL